MEELRRIYSSWAAYGCGQQRLSERERAMEMFQAEQVELIILTSEAGAPAYHCMT
jgi:hypothetical protein